MAYEDFKSLINDLFDGEKDGEPLPISEIDESLFKDFKDQKNDFWKYLLQYMNENGAIKQNQLLENKDDPNQSSLFGYINQKIDLDLIKNFWNNLIEQSYSDGAQLDKDSDTGKINPEDKNYFWNESLSKAISLFLLSFDLNRIKQKEEAEIKEKLTAIGYDEEKINNIVEAFKKGQYDLSDLKEKLGIDFKFDNGIKVGDTGITHFHISDIINADAGLDFVGPPWVRPQYNVDGDLYKEVRGIDKIESVLNSSKELQYTVSQEKDPHWIRLLMPKYLRYVEVEDLNRNFWVIGQTIAAISAFLFGDDSPLNELLKDILNEIAQLWQNIMYLWATATLMMQENEVTKVHTEVVILPNSDLESYIKFDNFGNTVPINESLEIDWDNILKRTHYLIEQYSTCNLVIVPCIRYNNYKHNYYNEEIYPGIITYNRNNDKTNIIKFQIGEVINPIRINIDTYKDMIYAIRELEDEYEYYYPYSMDVTLDRRARFYGLLRTQFNIDVDFTKDLNDNNYYFIFNQFNLSIYDRSFEVLKDCPVTDTDFQNRNGQLGFYSINSFKIPSNKDKEIFVQPTIYEPKWQNANLGENITTQKVEIQKGFYQGELISQWNEVMATKYTIQTQGLPVVPILYFNENVMKTDVYLETIKAINRVNASGANEKLNGFLKNFGAIVAMQYIYDIEIGYYKNSRGESTNKSYNHSEMLNYLNNLGLLQAGNSENSVIDNVHNMLNSFDICSYLNIFVNSNGSPKSKTTIKTKYEEKYPDGLDIKIKFCLSSLFFYLLDMYNINTNLPADQSYETIPYVENATITASQYDQAALKLFGQQFIRNTYDSSLLSGNFILLETSRSQVILRGLGYQRQAVLIVDENGKIVNKEINDVLTDAGGGEELPRSKYYANSFLLFGQYPEGDQRYTALMAYPNADLTYQIYPKHHEYYRASKYGSDDLLSAGIGYKINENNVGEFYVEGHGQPVNTIQQNLIMIKKEDDNMTVDNWCAVTVKSQYIYDSKLFWDQNQQDRTYTEQYLLGGERSSIITTDQPINFDEDYQILQMKNQRDVCQTYVTNAGGVEWMGELNGSNYFIGTPLAVQNTVSVFTNDGKYGQRIFIRECRPIDKDTGNKNEQYLKWGNKIEIKTDGQDVDQLRNNYKVIANNIIGYNYERFKSNGQYIPGSGGNFPKDDDDSSYNIEAINGLLDTKYHSNDIGGA